MPNQLKMKVMISKMHKIEGKNGTVAICDLNINGEFAVNGILLNQKNGVFYLVFPTRVVSRRGTKEHLDICHPVTAEARLTITELVAQEWRAKYGQDTAV